METMTLHWFFAKCWTILDEKFEQNQTWSNIIQHNATISNMVFKRTQHVGHNNVGWCWYNMLHPFKQALRPHKRAELQPRSQALPYLDGANPFREVTRKFAWIFMASCKKYNLNFVINLPEFSVSPPTYTFLGWNCPFAPFLVRLCSDCQA